MTDLTGRVCLVTGGSRGIGRAAALVLAAHGADVAVNYARNREAAEQVAASLRENGRRAEVYGADIADGGQVGAMVDKVIADFGRIDVLVNNAGILRDRTFVKMSRRQWDEVISTNLTGAFNVTQKVLPFMLDQGGGRIINISSVVGQTGAFGQANYAAAKAGLIALTATLAREVSRKGVLVNAIAPGFTETDMTATIPPDVMDKIVKQIPMQRMGKPEEVAGAILFLAGPHSAYITGQVIAVNGGIYM